jgi:hypothetical protein
MTKSQGRLSMPGVLLRLEGLAVLAGALALYTYQGYGWLAFGLLFLAPDLAIGVYALDQRAGRIAYNLVHTYSLPLVLAVAGLWGDFGLGLQLALIWFAHIGMDRMLGYGLKYPDSFKETHLSRV